MTFLGYFFKSFPLV